MTDPVTFNGYISKVRANDFFAVVKEIGRPDYPEEELNLWKTSVPIRERQYITVGRFLTLTIGNGKPRVTLAHGAKRLTPLEIKRAKEQAEKWLKIFPA